MRRRIARRDFLKTASAAAGAFAYAAGHPLADAQAPRPADTRLSGTSYTPIPDYPIRAKRFSEVALSDAFWKPKIATNATVTIPFEVQKLAEAARSLSGNVLEAAILSLETHPDPALQAQVDARGAAIARARTARAATTDSRSRSPGTTPRASAMLLDRAITHRRRALRGLSRDTTRRSPAASATRSTACSSIAPRTTRSISTSRSTTSTFAGSRTP